MIKEISIDNADEWDAVVRSFFEYEVFYLSTYARAFMEEDQTNGTPILLLYQNNGDRAINVIFKRDIALDTKMQGKIEKGKYYDIITPYGYGGFCGKVSDWSELNREYNYYCVKNNYISEFVRFNLFSEYVNHYDGIVESRTHNIIRSLEMTIDDVWMDFKHKVRKNVNRANVYGLNVIVDDKAEYLDDFLRIYYLTMDRKDAREEYYFSRRFFEEITKLNNNAIYFHAIYEGTIISTELILCGPNNIYSYLGGTDSRYNNLRPNDYLKFEIIKWAMDKGYRNYVLGGGYGSDDGIFQFKYALAPHGIVDFNVGKKIYDREKYDRLVSMRNPEELNDVFFPLYRS